MKYFTSDTHFGHSNVIGYCNRPFHTVETMNQTILDNFREVLTEDDELYFLGDWSMHPKYYELIREIPFKHLYFVYGNHDRFKKLKELSEFPEFAGRVTIGKTMVCSLGAVDFFLVHRPMDASVTSPTLCGHVHEKWLFQQPGATIQEYRYHGPSVPRTLEQPVLNVGVDVHDFRLVSEAYILEWYQEMKSATNC